MDEQQCSCCGTINKLAFDESEADLCVACYELNQEMADEERRESA